LPGDAEEVYKKAIPGHPENPKHWYGKNEEGNIYRYSDSKDGTMHYSGQDNLGDGLRELDKYIKERLIGK
jgi:hypothetical protein